MRLRYILVLLSISLSEGNTDPPGHNLPFGSHTVPHQVESVDEFPSPQDFYEKYQGPGRPVVFKSILKKVNFPPYRLWTDDYFRENFGHYEVEIEKGKKETREGDMLFQTMADFLDMYKEKDVYMVQDVKHGMKSDMRVPRSFKCGGSKDHIETIVMWFSSGGTKSVIHFDTQENYNCLLDGNKDLVIVDRKYKPLMEADGWKPDGSFSKIDVDKVDMHKYPKIKEIPTFSVHLEPGDCLYIPYRWYHQVNSYGKRNLAVNVWFTHIPWFNYTDCEGVSADEQTLPFMDYGYINRPKRELGFLLETLFDTKNVTRDTFLEHFVLPEADDKDAILKFVDKNGDMDLTWDELLSINVRDFVHRFRASLVGGEQFEESVEEVHGMFGRYEDDTSNDAVRDEL